MRLPALLFLVVVAVAGCGDDGASVTPDAGCPAGQELCGSTCVNVQADNTNCGACGNVCAAGEVCSAGACALSCPAGQLACGGGCVDPGTDRMHCGATADCEGANAGEACDAGEVCNGSGVCELSCQAGLVACNGTCIDPNTDRAYCGATADCGGANAGEACDAGEVCNGSGVCELSCQAGLVACNGTCIDPNTDRAYCGATADCQGANAGDTCDAGEICNGSGVCELSCQADLLACNGTCIDPASNHTYCGASMDCQGANAGVTCAANEGCDAGVCRPFVAFSNVTFPIAVPGPVGGYGQLELAFGGDLFVAGGSAKDIFRVSELDGSVTTFATDVNTTGGLLSLAYDAGANVLYAGSEGGELLQVSSSGAVSSFASVAGQLNTLAIAPAGFGAYGGQIIVGSTLGLYAVDGTTTPATVTAISTSAGNISDLTFLGGALYAAIGSSIVTIEPDATVTPLTTFAGAVDGITYDPKRNVFYAAESTSDALYTVSTDGTATSIGSYNFDDGFFISGLLLVNPDLLVIGTGESGLSLSSLALP